MFWNNNNDDLCQPFCDRWEWMNILLLYCEVVLLCILKIQCQNSSHIIINKCLINMCVNAICWVIIKRILFLLHCCIYLTTCCVCWLLWLQDPCDSSVAGIRAYLPVMGGCLTEGWWQVSIASQSVWAVRLIEIYESVWMIRYVPYNVDVHD